MRSGIEPIPSATCLELYNNVAYSTLLSSGCSNIDDALEGGINIHGITEVRR